MHVQQGRRDTSRENHRIDNDEDHHPRIRLAISPLLDHEAPAPDPLTIVEDFCLIAYKHKELTNSSMRIYMGIAGNCVGRIP